MCSWLITPAVPGTSGTARAEPRGFELYSEPGLKATNPLSASLFLMGTKKRHRDQLRSFTTTTFWLLRDAQWVSQRPRVFWKGRTKPHLSLRQDFLLVQLEGSSYSSPYNRWLLPGIQGVFSWQLSRQLLQAENAVSHPGDAAAEPCPCKTPHSPSTLAVE